MEALGAILKPHFILLGKTAVTITFLQLFSPAFMVNTIRQRKSTKGFPLMPLAGGLVLTILGLKLAGITKDDIMIRINLCGFVLHVIYALIFYIYTPTRDKAEIWSQIGKVGLLPIAVFVYCELEDPNNLEFRINLIATGFLVFLLGSPFLELGKIIREKSVGYMPIAIVVSGTLVSFSWLLYGLSIQNTTAVYQNLLLGSLGLAQMFLYVIYPPKSMVEADLKKKKKK